MNCAPLRLTDPTGHWSEDELADALGENWQELYFGEGGVFADREALLAFLLSQDTTSPIILDLVRQFFEFSDLVHGAGVDFANVDALGSRLSFGVGAAGFASLSADVILNLRSGEMSFFGSPEGGFILGGSLSLVGGMTFLREMPSNDSLRGSFMAVGLVGGDVVGADVEAFWSSPVTDQFRAFDKAYGLFLGVGPAVQLGMYGSMGYSFELFRYDVSGDHWFPYAPNVLTVAQDIGWAFAHDVLLHPVWPWSPYR